MGKTGTGRRSSRVSNGLVALSSAAVIGIYSAGYVRTKPAAARFARAAERRPAAPLAPAPAFEVRPETRPVEKPRLEARPDPTPPPPPDVRPKRRREARRPAVRPVVQAPSAVLPVVATEALAPPPAEPAPSADPQPPRIQYKDGTYLGWGTSRHGDIQASVVIEDGRIASATIAQCLTRYSCSWIAALPPQVVTRQSPEVDYISGATQSTNAFYYAVVEALSKAK